MINLDDVKYKKTFRKISKNINSTSDFIDSDKIGVDFDKVKKNFQKHLKDLSKNTSSKDVFNSCDSLIYDSEKYIFIEFKDKRIDSETTKQINKKIVHSSFMLEYIENKSIFDMEISFILVYSEEKNEMPNKELKAHLEGMAETNIKFSLDDTMNKMINSVKVMTETEFIKYCSSQAKWYH